MNSLYNGGSSKILLRNAMLSRNFTGSGGTSQGLNTEVLLYKKVLFARDELEGVMLCIHSTLRSCTGVATKIGCARQRLSGSSVQLPGINHSEHGLSALVEAWCGWVRESSALDSLVAALTPYFVVANNMSRKGASIHSLNYR